MSRPEKSHQSHLLLSTYHFWGPNQNITLHQSNLNYPFSGPENPLQMANFPAFKRWMQKDAASEHEEKRFQLNRLRHEHENIEHRLLNDIQALASLQIKDRQTRLSHISGAIRNLIQEQVEEMERGDEGGEEWSEAERFQAGLRWRLRQAQDMWKKGEK